MEKGEKIKNVFIDSSAFVALNRTSDSLHSQAFKFLKFLHEQKVQLITGTHILLETATILSQDLGHKKAVEFLSELRNGGTEIIHPSEDLIFEAEELFKQQTSKNVSYADCVSFVVMQKYSISVAFSFDQDFKKNGFVLMEEALKN